MTTTPLPQTTDFAVCFVADPHRPQSPEQHLAHVLTGIDWAFAQPVRPCLIVELGDGNGPEFLWYLLEQRPQYASVVRKKVLGNHDGDVPFGAPSGTTPENPFSYCIAGLPGNFPDGKEWWSYDVQTNEGRATHVRVIGLNNCTPYTMQSGQQAYPEVNPPGHWDQPNPDHTGLTIVGSPQRLFILEKIAQPRPDWLIVAAHRGWGTAFDSDPRREAWETRFLCDQIEMAGGSLFATGDKHIGSLAKIGRAWYLGLAGGYFVRPTDPSVLPAGTLRWHSGSPDPLCGLAHVAHLEFFGDSAALKVFECSDADPAGGIVHEETLNRNGGVAGSLESQ